MIQQKLQPTLMMLLQLIKLLLKELVENILHSRSEIWIFPNSLITQNSDITYNHG